MIDWRFWTNMNESKFNIFFSNWITLQFSVYHLMPYRMYRNTSTKTSFLPTMLGRSQRKSIWIGCVEGTSVLDPALLTSIASVLSPIPSRRSLGWGVISHTAAILLRSFDWASSQHRAAAAALVCFELSVASVRRSNKLRCPQLEKVCS